MLIAASPTSVTDMQLTVMRTLNPASNGAEAVECVACLVECMQQLQKTNRMQEASRSALHAITNCLSWRQRRQGSARGLMQY
jgi:hypothetical protein